MSASLSFVQLPVTPLVTPTEAEAIRLKVASSRLVAEYEAFWQAIQDSKQPRPVDYAELGVLE